MKPRLIPDLGPSLPQLAAALLNGLFEHPVVMIPSLTQAVPCSRGAEKVFDSLLNVPRRCYFGRYLSKVMSGS